MRAEGRSGWCEGIAWSEDARSTTLNGRNEQNLLGKEDQNEKNEKDHGAIAHRW